jgi:hypothetical protein
MGFRFYLTLKKVFMNTRFLIIIFSFLFLLLNTNCRKGDSNFNYYFITSVDTSEAKLSLYIDDKYIAPLPYVPDSTDTSAIFSAPNLFLKIGRYKITAKDSNGIVRMKAKAVVRPNGFKLSGEQGSFENFYFTHLNVSSSKEEIISVLDLFY